VVIALWALGEKAHSQDLWPFRKGQVLGTGVPQLARPSSVQHTGPTFIDMHDQSQIHGGKWDIKYWDGAKPGSMDFDIWTDLRKGALTIHPQSWTRISVKSELVATVRASGCQERSDWSSAGSYWRAISAQGIPNRKRFSRFLKRRSHRGRQEDVFASICSNHGGLAATPPYYRPLR